MTIQQLRYAVAISEAGSLNKASETLYVAQHCVQRHHPAEADGKEHDADILTGEQNQYPTDFYMISVGCFHSLLVLFPPSGRWGESSSCAGRKTRY